MGLQKYKKERNSRPMLTFNCDYFSKNKNLNFYWLF